MTKPQQIQTREQLIHELEDILSKHFYDIVEREPAAEEICDLIADLPNQCFHKEEIADEDDGQPSELTEWQDYDPDC